VAKVDLVELNGANDRFEGRLGQLHSWQAGRISCRFFVSTVFDTKDIRHN
jgi:hypothetical protein